MNPATTAQSRSVFCCLLTLAAKSAARASERNSTKDKERASLHSSDLAFVASILASEQRFQELVNLYQERVRLKAFRFAHQDLDRSELVNEIFFQVYISLAKFKGKSSLSTWIDTIGTRVCYRFLKKRYREKKRQEIVNALLLRKSNVETDSTSSQKTAREQIEESMMQLKTDERIVLTLLYWEACTVKDAASQLGWSVSNIKVTAHRARKKLRDILECRREC